MRADPRVRFTETVENYRRYRPGYPAALVDGARGAELANSQWLDREGLIGRVWSASYVVHGVRDQKAFRKALLASFEEHARDGRVEFCYRCVALAFEPRA